MPISQVHQPVRGYANQFKTLVGHWASYDERVMLNQFILGLRSDLTYFINLHYQEKYCMAVVLAKTAELAIKAPGMRSEKSTPIANPAKTQKRQAKEGEVEERVGQECIKDILVDLVDKEEVEEREGVVDKVLVRYMNPRDDMFMGSIAIWPVTVPKVQSVHGGNTRTYGKH